MTKLADRVFYIEEWPGTTPRLTVKTWAEDEGLGHPGGILMIWSMRNGWGIHCDVVNPKRFELQAAKEILAEMYEIQVSLEMS
ncbi:MAG: hypothetical protein LUQ38_03395 [Methanotrichaceae archaeon]|nr:hypothetical protein [Methanotrichaceae archaeon]